MGPVPMVINDLQVWAKATIGQFIVEPKVTGPICDWANVVDIFSPVDRHRIDSSVALATAWIAQDPSGNFALILTLTTSRDFPACPVLNHGESGRAQSTTFFVVR